MSRQLYAAIALMMLLASPTWAQLAHRYSFTSDANDSVGTAHGTVVDPGTTANFTFTGGQLDVSANAGNASNAITEDAYVNLPNGMISAAAAAGDSGEIAFEIWGTISETRTWSRFWDFGTSNGGEDVSDSGSDVPQIWLAANSGRHGDGSAAASSTLTGGLGEVGSTTAFAVGTQHQLLATFNHNNPRSGPNGTISFYIDGGLIGHAPISPSMDLNTFTNNNNWLGRSQWGGDPIFDGSFNEFRIYNNAPNDAYAAASFAAGPDSLAPFTPWVLEFDLGFEINRDTGTLTLSNDGPSIDVVSIQISSPNGALVPANLRSVTDNYDFDSGASFDSNDTWNYVDGVPPTAFLLSEVEPDGDGAKLGTGNTVNLQLGVAGAWTPSTYEDVVVTVQRLLPDFSIDTINVPVTYTGGLGAAPTRSDLDSDGDVDLDDYQELVAGHLTDLSGLTAATSWSSGDLDGDLDNDYGDFRLFQQDYDAANGVGAFAAAIGAVPEPSSLALFLASGLWTVTRRRRV